MKFGKLEILEGVNLRLPADHRDTLEGLSKGSKGLKVYTGGTMWNIPAWLGKVYPIGTRKVDFIQAYGRQFSTIELNATHYKIPTKEVILKWKEEMPSDFIFCPKFPQTISHYRRFNNCDEITLEFLEVVSLLETQLGPSFIQLPPNYTAQKADVLKRYLTALPRDMKFAIEFRHESWFDGNADAESVWRLMTELNIGSVISDTAGRRDAVHMRLTTPECIVRFGGNGLDPSDELRLKEWGERIAIWKENGLETFHLWMHQPNSVLTPETCVMFSTIIEEATGVKCKSPEIFKSELF